MEPSIDFIHFEIETGLILLRMASIVDETELFTCAERLRRMADKAHQRAARHLKRLPLSDPDRQALLAKIQHLEKGAF